MDAEYSNLGAWWSLKVSDCGERGGAELLLMRRDKVPEWEQARATYDAAGEPLPGGFGPYSLGHGRRFVKSEAEIQIENRRRSARRAVTRVRQACRVIGADRLLTLTYRDNVTDFERARRDLRAFFELCRKHGIRMRYVAVAERQERGAFHWHLALDRWVHVALLRRVWARVLGVKCEINALPLQLGESSPGNVDIKRTRRRQSVDRLAAYLAKYIAKAIVDDEREGLHRYSVSHHSVAPSHTQLRYYATFADAVAALMEHCQFWGGRPYYWTSADGRVVFASVEGSGSAQAGP